MDRPAPTPLLQDLKLSGLDLYFAMARGAEGAPASDMSKFCDTNYHYVVSSGKRRNTTTCCTLP